MGVTSIWPWNAHGITEHDVDDHKKRNHMVYFIAKSGYISHVCQPSFGYIRSQPKATKTATVSSFCSAFSVDNRGGSRISLRGVLLKERARNF